MVSVTGLGEVRAVELATDWKRRTDPRRLSTHVLPAANDATLRAASAQAEISEAAPMPPEPVGTLDGLGDKWGKPNDGVDLSDGSVSDGDASNWEAR